MITECYHSNCKYHYNSQGHEGSFGDCPLDNSELLKGCPCQEDLQSSECYEKHENCKYHDQPEYDQNGKLIMETTGPFGMCPLKNHEKMKDCPCYKEKKEIGR